MLDVVFARYGETPRVEQRSSVGMDELGALDRIDPESELVVPLALWLKKETQERLADRKVVVLLKGADDPLLLQETLHLVAGVAIDFPVFTDGRGYSAAALLRERLGYDGEIRAVGDVLRDQAFILQRAGFDAFVPRADRSIAGFIDGFRDFRVVYQKSPVNPPLFRVRAAAFAAIGESG
jgi:uncharacterized protein (DUF934 family)